MNDRAIGPAQRPVVERELDFSPPVPTNATRTVGDGELENTSSNPLEIEVHSSPLQYLDLIVADASGAVVSDSYYGDLFSPLAEPYTLSLRPGENYTAPVSLLGNVSEGRRRPGQYTVHAVYAYRTWKAVSDALPVILPRAQ